MKEGDQDKILKRQSSLPVELQIKKALITKQQTKHPAGDYTKYAKSATIRRNTLNGENINPNIQQEQEETKKQI